MVRGVPRMLVPGVLPKQSAAAKILHGKDPFRAKLLYRAAMVCEPMHLFNDAMGFAKPTAHITPSFSDVARAFIAGDNDAVRETSAEVVRALNRGGWALEGDTALSLALVHVEPEQTEEEFLLGTEMAFGIVCASLAEYGIGVADDYADGPKPSHKKKHTHRLLPSQAGMLPRVLVPSLFEAATADEAQSRVAVGDMVAGMGYPEEVQLMRIPGHCCSCFSFFLFIILRCYSPVCGQRESHITPYRPFSYLLFSSVLFSCLLFFSSLLVFSRLAQTTWAIGSFAAIRQTT